MRFTRTEPERNDDRGLAGGRTTESPRTIGERRYAASAAAIPRRRPSLAAGRCVSFARVGSPSAAPDLYTWTMPKQKRPFLVEIEAKLTVHAFDEDSARKKVEKAFASGRPLGVDIHAGAGVWTYAVVPAEQASGS